MAKFEALKIKRCTIDSNEEFKVRNIVLIQNEIPNLNLRHYRQIRSFVEMNATLYCFNFGEFILLVHENPP